MRTTSRFSYLKALIPVALVLVGGAVLAPAAEAQARGTLQATATVVDTKQGFGALDAARQAVRSVTDSRIESRIESSTVATVAQVSIGRAADRPSALVVTIDFSRN